ncbi:MAG TPA: hypothetical protein VKA66_15290 [Mycobacterium sp.]|nr:hypothetical protein [Mycobacterium sp.]
MRTPSSKYEAVQPITRPETASETAATISQPTPGDGTFTGTRVALYAGKSGATMTSLLSLDQALAEWAPR